jgi:hypothetical protein
VIDGKSLFTVRGASSFPAANRAAVIATRIEQAAEERSFQPESLRVAPEGENHAIFAGPLRIMLVTGADAGRPAAAQAVALARGSDSIGDRRLPAIANATVSAIASMRPALDSGDRRDHVAAVGGRPLHILSASYKRGSIRLASSRSKSAWVEHVRRGLSTRFDSSRSSLSRHCYSFGSILPSDGFHGRPVRQRCWNMSLRHW